MTNNQKIGMDGEKYAVKYLKEHNFRILETNWRYQHKEVDIIALQDDILCIIEVKTRQSDYLPPRDAVHKKKQHHLIEAANAYIIKYNLDFETRFDIIELVIIKDKIKLNHIVDAFKP